MRDALARSRRRHAAVLALLLAAFFGRVFAQALQGWRPVSWLPPFESWHSGAVPYPVLLAVQAALAAAGLLAVWRVGTGRTRPNRRLGRLLLGLGAIYFAVMAGRLILGLTLLVHVDWFQGRLATVFHLVLAAFVLTLARFHLRHAPRA